MKEDNEQLKDMIFDIKSLLALWSEKDEEARENAFKNSRVKSFKEGFKMGTLYGRVSRLYPELQCWDCGQITIIWFEFENKPFCKECFKKVKLWKV